MKSLLCAGVVLVAITANGQSLHIRAIGYEMGQTGGSVSCTHSGTNISGISDGSTDCQTVNSRQSLREEVEGDDGFRYLLACAAGPIWHNTCHRLIPGHLFNAEIDGATMHVYGHSKKGKEKSAVYTIIRREKASQATATTAEAKSDSSLDGVGRKNPPAKQEQEERVLIAAPPPAVAVTLSQQQIQQLLVLNRLPTDKDFSEFVGNSMATWINADQSRVARWRAGGDSASNVLNEAFEHVVKNLNAAARSTKQ